MNESEHLQHVYLIAETHLGHLYPQPCLFVSFKTFALQLELLLNEAHQPIRPAVGTYTPICKLNCVPQAFYQTSTTNMAQSRHPNIVLFCQECWQVLDELSVLPLSSFQCPRHCDKEGYVKFFLPLDKRDTETQLTHLRWWFVKNYTDSNTERISQHSSFSMLEVTVHQTPVLFLLVWTRIWAAQFFLFSSGQGEGADSGPQPSDGGGSTQPPHKRAGRPQTALWADCKRFVLFDTGHCLLTFNTYWLSKYVF